jgi:small-conductance mechanosensitive channel
MRLVYLVVLFGLLGGVAAPPPAAAQSVAVHQAAAPAAAPAKAPSATIIPGSPLAALTGGGDAAKPPAEVDTASPFGSNNIGLSLTSVIGAETTHTINTFTAAVKRSTELTPVADWLETVPKLPARRADALHILRGLAITVVPAWLVERLVHFALARPRAAVAARAAQRLALLTNAPPAPEPEEEISDELETPTVEPAPAAKIRRRKRISLRLWGRRFVRALLYFGLALLPILCFALTGGVLLGLGIITTRQARLAIIVVSNAYLGTRLVLEALRFLFAPRAPALRLVAISDFRANWILLWARVILFTGASGFALISICEILGLGRAGTQVLIRLIALAAHVEVALMIWQGRRVVCRWISGHRGATGAVATFRQRFGRIWHYFALFYVLALWIALAGGVHNAFGVLLRVVMVFFAAVFFGRLAWVGSAHLLERLFPDTPTVATRRSALYARARVYNPLMGAVIRVVIVVAVLVTILQGWGFPIIPWLVHDKFSRALLSAFISIIITIAIALTIWEICNGLLNDRINRFSAAGRTRQASRLRTLLPMLRATIGVGIAIVAGLICLSKIGVNAAPLLAGAGVLGIAIGFGSQKLVQDIITGLFLLLEDAMQVGDVVNLASMQGTVEKLSIRTIRLRGGDGSVNIIPFSAVTTVTNMTRDFGYAQISIQIGYEEDLDHVSAVLTDIAKQMRAEPKWGAMIRDDLQIFGLDQFGASALVITGQIRTGPGQHWAVRREFYARVKTRFEADHIDMPYTYLPPPPRIIEQAPEAPPLDQAGSAAGHANSLD